MSQTNRLLGHTEGSSAQAETRERPVWSPDLIRSGRPSRVSERYCDVATAIRI